MLSTLHTNDAPSAITRLLNMGIEPFLIASSVILVLAQRLLRRICMHCKVHLVVPPEALMEVGLTPEEVASITCYKGNGCELCGGTGYKGRIAIYEVMTLSPDPAVAKKVFGKGIDIYMAVSGTNRCRCACLMAVS